MCLQTVLEYPSICLIKGRSDLHAPFMYALGYRVRYKVNGFPTILAEVKPNTIVQRAFDSGLNSPAVVSLGSILLL